MSKTTKRNRRPLNAAQQWQPPLLFAVIAGQIDTHTLRFEFHVPDGGEGVPEAISLRGTPAFVWIDDLSLPASAVQETETSIRVTWAALITPGSEVGIPAYDAAIRTNSGAWVAPGLLLTS